MKVAIIGGGAAGLMCAISAKKNNIDVTIYEKNNKCGKKILITGNGKCNYFNSEFTINHYNSKNIDILEKIINEDNKNMVLKKFESIGIIPKIQNGYYYPVTNQATTIQSQLINEATFLGVKFEYECEVLDVNYDNKFVIKTNKGIYYADKVVISSGSNSAPKTGSDGFGYELLKKFGHSIITPLPSLVQLKANEKFLKDWAGVRCDVSITHYENDKKLKKEFGEVQLTDYGVSGICVFQLSSKIVRGLYEGKKECICINFLPWLKEDIKEFISKRNTMMKNRNISELLDGILNYKLVNLILKKNNIQKNTIYEELSKNQINNLTSDLVNFKLNITGYNDFNSSQVTSGGVPLTEININNFESKKQSGLYIIGEILDVDGNCGGYNLGFAWISGMLSGNFIGENV